MTYICQNVQTQKYLHFDETTCCKFVLTSFVITVLTRAVKRHALMACNTATVSMVTRSVHFDARVVSWCGIDLEEEWLGSSEMSVQGLENGQFPWERKAPQYVKCMCVCVVIQIVRGIGPPFFAPVDVNQYYNNK